MTIRNDGPDTTASSVRPQEAGQAPGEEPDTPPDPEQETEKANREASENDDEPTG